MTQQQIETDNNIHQPPIQAPPQQVPLQTLPPPPEQQQSIPTDNAANPTIQIPPQQPIKEEEQIARALEEVAIATILAIARNAKTMKNTLKKGLKLLNKF